MATEKRLVDINDVFGKIISAQVPRKGINLLQGQQWTDTVSVVRYTDILSHPTVDAEEVEHGCNVYDHDTSFECSVCGWGDWDTLTADSCKYNYCPNCGAKMDEETKFVGICERCEYRDECDWPKLHPKIELKKCPDFNEGEKNKNG